MDDSEWQMTAEDVVLETLVFQTDKLDLSALRLTQVPRILGQLSQLKESPTERRLASTLALVNRWVAEKTQVDVEHADLVTHLLSLDLASLWLGTEAQQSEVATTIAIAADELDEDVEAAANALLTAASYGESHGNLDRLATQFQGSVATVQHHVPRTSDALVALLDHFFRIETLDLSDNALSDLPSHLASFTTLLGMSTNFGPAVTASFGPT